MTPAEITAPEPLPDGAPRVGPVAQRIYQAIRPLADHYDDAHIGWPFLALAAGHGAPLEAIYRLALDDPDRGRRGYGLDLDTWPDEGLGYLAQFRGIRLPDGVTGDQARAFIRSGQGADVGTPGAQRALAASFLIEGATAADVRLLERAGGNRWAVTVIVREDQVPDIAAFDRMVDALLAPTAKPLGQVLNVTAVEGFIIDEVTATIDSVTATIDTYGS